MSTGQDRSGQRAAASAAVQRASKILLARQDAAGWWADAAAAVSTLEAEALLVREVLGIATPELTSAAAQQLRSQQQADGSWTGGCAGGDWAGGDLCTSVLAYLALRLAGDSADAYHMAVAAGWIRDAGGVASTTISARAWLAVFGLTEWADVHVPGPEVIYLPARYWPARADWASLGRQAAVSLAVVGTLRPLRLLSFDLNELRTAGQEPAGPDRRPRPRLPPLSSARSAAQAVALRRCGQWITSWQLRDGLPAGRRPALSWSLVALHSLGYPAGHPALAGGLAWLDSVTAQPRPAAGIARPVPERQPPVLDTALAVTALAEAGLPADHPALVNAGRWLLAQRIEGPADWPGARSGAAPSGWSFDADGYPGATATAQVLIALSRVNPHRLAAEPATDTAASWLTGVQCRDGSWDHSAVVTAQAVRALAVQGPPDGRAIRRGVVWLLLAQRPDGCWPGQSDDSDLPATTTVLAGLLAAGVLPAKPVIRTAVGWLLARQNLDSGWAAGLAQTSSDAPGTAHAVAALLAAGDAELSDPVGRGADWLVQAQQASGCWGDSSAGRNAPGRRAGLGPGLLLPLTALGRYLAARGAGRDITVGALAGGEITARALAGDEPPVGERARAIRDSHR
jgi:squalene-hopene/tetraprenyl-beta-curcumene cyclase